MGYVLVNLKDKNRALDINNWGWRAVRALLIGAGWEPMGATGHWDIMTDTPLDVPLLTESDRRNSYEGCCLQVVRTEDALAMLEAARRGISLCESDPEGAFCALHKLKWDEETAEMTPEAISEAAKEVRSLLQMIAAFVEHGAFFVD